MKISSALLKFAGVFFLIFLIIVTYSAYATGR
jgi:cbb3-type cytochrome oxidase subunit 3